MRVSAEVAIEPFGYGGVAGLHRDPNVDPMTEERLPLAELLAKARDGDFLRGVAEAVLQLLMEADAGGVTGAGQHERSGERTTYRNGSREPTLDTRLRA
jgi:transposase-like protein